MMLVNILTWVSGMMIMITLIWLGGWSSHFCVMMVVLFRPRPTRWTRGPWARRQARFEGVYQFLQGLPSVHRHGVLCGGPVLALCQSGLGSPDGVGAGGPPAYVL